MSKCLLAHENRCYFVIVHCPYETNLLKPYGEAGSLSSSHPPHSSSVLHFINCSSSLWKFRNLAPLPCELELVTSLKSFFAPQFESWSMFLFDRSNLGLSLCFAPVQCPMVKQNLSHEL